MIICVKCNLFTNTDTLKNTLKSILEFTSIKNVCFKKESFKLDFIFFNNEHEYFNAVHLLRLLQKDIPEMIYYVCCRAIDTQLFNDQYSDKTSSLNNKNMEKSRFKAIGYARKIKLENKNHNKYTLNKNVETKIKDFLQIVVKRRIYLQFLSTCIINDEKDRNELIKVEMVNNCKKLYELLKNDKEKGEI